MAGTLVYVIGFIFSVSMLILFPKKQDKVNFIVDSMFSYVTVLCVASLLAFLLNVIKVPITLFSMGGLFALIGIIAAIGTASKKRIQHHFIRKTDIISVFVLVLAVGVFALYIFTPYIHANYYNQVDPYEHFLYAVSILRSGKLSGMFFNSLYNGMFIGMFEWLLPQSWLYKAFIVSDIYHIVLELLFFYAVLRVAGNNKIKKYSLLTISLFYWGSFLMFSFIWGFVYWSMAIMLAEYVVILLKLYMEKSVSSKTLLILMIAGLFAVTMCYIELAPGMALTVFVIVCYDYVHDKKISWNFKYVKYGIFIMLVLAGMAFAGYHYVFGSRGMVFFAVLQMGKQQNIGLELVLMFPLVMYILTGALREKKKLTAFQTAYLTNAAVQILFTVLSICHVISTYYLQKQFFILFFLSIMVILEGCTQWGHKQIQSIGLYAAAALGFLIFSYDGENSSTFSLQQSTIVQNLDIVSNYDFQEGALSDNDKIYLMQYAMEEMRKDGSVIPLIISTPGERGIGLWLDATYNDATVIWLEDISCSEEEMEKLLEGKGATHFMVFFDDLLYIYDLHDYFDSFEWVYRNDAGFIGKFK